MYGAKLKHGNSYIEGYIFKHQGELYIIKKDDPETCLSFSNGDYILEDYDMYEKIDDSTLYMVKDN